MNSDAPKGLEDVPTPIKTRLALMWASLMSLYIYNDYFSLYTPNTLSNIGAGRMGPLGPATEGVLLGVAILLAIPALMIALSAILPAFASRWLNVLFGLIYTAVEVLTFGGRHLFYNAVIGLELILTVLIVWFALRWPRRAQS